MSSRLPCKHESYFSRKYAPRPAGQPLVMGPTPHCPFCASDAGQDLAKKVALSAANRRIEELEKALRSEREGIAKWLENQTWREIPSDPSALAAEIRALSTPSARAEEPKCTCGHKLHPFNACTARSGGTANPCSCLGGGSVPPSEEPEECWACRGYGHFSSWGEPSADKRDRKCLECRGEGKVPAQAKEGE